MTAPSGSEPRADGVRVGPSAIHGEGVFAARPFAATETVLVIDDSRVVDDTHPLRPELGEMEHHRDFLGGGKVVLMQPPERSINSSCDPSTVVKTVDGVRRVIAVRPIRSGEEITYDYILNCHGGLEWRCRCGSRRCRGLVPASFFDLPRREQRRLRPWLDAWFVAEHRDRLARRPAGPPVRSG